jgi:hypothetical protein
MEFLINHNYIVIWLGALLVHYFSANNKSVNASQNYIRKMFPGWAEKYYYLIDIIITPILGTIFAFFTIHPVDLSSAFFSGSIWYVAFVSTIQKVKFG